MIFLSIANSMKLQPLALAGASAHIAVALTLLTTTVLSSSALADSGSGAGMYRGQGYTVTIGENGSYYGCDARNRCLSIQEPTGQEGDSYMWEKAGTVYEMTRISAKGDPRYILKVTNPRGKVILKRTLTAIGVGG
jgi:hypothetical protein